MDLRCPKCGEPWEMDELHYVEGMSFDEAWKKFRKDGCKVFDTEHGEVNENAAEVAGMLYDMLGDDVDGAASMLDDAEFLGVID